MGQVVTDEGRKSKSINIVTLLRGPRPYKGHGLVRDISAWRVVTHGIRRTKTKNSVVIIMYTTPIQRDGLTDLKRDMRIYDTNVANLSTDRERCFVKVKNVDTT